MCGGIELLINNEWFLVPLVMLLFGQRLAKDPKLPFNPTNTCVLVEALLNIYPI
jgi:hypothetical protein